MKELLRETNAYRTVLADANGNRAAHAVLVVFPDEGYLRALLRECAKAFFLADDGTRAADLIGQEKYADCIFLPAAGEKFGVDAASRVPDECALRPVEGDKKLFVLDGLQAAPPLVQNKLLKVFEEPPEGVYFLAGTTNEHAVLPTVRSRMKRAEVPPFSKEQIERALLRMHPGIGNAEEAAAASGGILSAAEKFAEGGGESFALAERFLSGETEEVCRALDKADKAAFFAAVKKILYDMLLISAGQGKYASHASGEAARLAGEYPAGAISASLTLAEKAERELTFNANPIQCAYHLALGIAGEKRKWQKLSS